MAKTSKQSTISILEKFAEEHTTEEALKIVDQIRERLQQDDQEGPSEKERRQYESLLANFAALPVEEQKEYVEALGLSWERIKPKTWTEAPGRIDLEPRDKVHWVDKIPMRLLGALTRYRDNGRETGDFLKAVLGNDLKGVINYGDPASMEALRPLIWWLQRFMPHDAWGSKEKVAAWMKSGGCQHWSMEQIQSWNIKTQNELREIGRKTEI